MAQVYMRVNGKVPTDNERHQAFAPIAAMFPDIEPVLDFKGYKILEINDHFVIVWWEGTERLNGMYFGLGHTLQDAMEMMIEIVMGHGATS